VKRARRLAVAVLAAAGVALPAPALAAPAPPPPPPAAPTLAAPAPPAPALAALAPPAPAGAGCPGAQVPPAPAADEELSVVVKPLPWPAQPVGGSRLAACGAVLRLGFTPPPEIGAAAWVLADLDTGAVLAAHAPHARHRPASTLKVLTALVAIEHLDPDTVVEGTLEDANIEGSRAGIGPGGRYSVRQLLAGLLLNSGNDTANALARALGGPVETVAMMNATARRFGALDTRAATPSGLDGPGMASSAYDLAVLFRVAMREPLFAQTIVTRSVVFPGYGTQAAFTLVNSGKLLARYPGTVGGKTGFTDAARHSFVGAAERDGRRLVIALVRGEQAPVPMWRQAATLLDAGFALPDDTPALGTLVDSAPRPPRPPPPRPLPTNAPADGLGGVLPVTAPPVVPFALAAAACAGVGGLLLRRYRGGG